MAILHQATVSPPKPDILRQYLPTVSELGLVPDAEITILGSYRFDDPAGEVGMETHLIATADGRTLHVPLTYRAGPLDEAEAWFVTTLEHSALGTRWVYNGCGDPVYAAELVRTIVTGATQVKLEILTADGTIERENTVHVAGSGRPSADIPAPTASSATRSGSDTIITVGASMVTVHHVLEPGALPAQPHLSGTWPGVDHPVTMATMSG